MNFKYGLLCGVHCELLIPLSWKTSGMSLRSICILLSWFSEVKGEAEVLQAP